MIRQGVFLQGSIKEHEDATEQEEATWRLSIHSTEDTVVISVLTCRAEDHSDLCIWVSRVYSGVLDAYRTGNNVLWFSFNHIPGIEKIQRGPDREKKKETDSRGKTRGRREVEEGEDEAESREEASFKRKHFPFWDSAGYFRAVRVACLSGDFNFLSFSFFFDYLITLIEMHNYCNSSFMNYVER